MPGYRYHMDLFFLLTLLRVLEENGFYFFIPIGKILEKAKLRPEKRFEANAH